MLIPCGHMGNHFIGSRLRKLALEDIGAVSGAFYRHFAVLGVFVIGVPKFERNLLRVIDVFPRCPTLAVNVTVPPLSTVSGVTSRSTRIGSSGPLSTAAVSLRPQPPSTVINNTITAIRPAFPFNGFPSFSLIPYIRFEIGRSYASLRQSRDNFVQLGQVRNFVIGLDFVARLFSVAIDPYGRHADAERAFDIGRQLVANHNPFAGIDP